RPAELLGAQYQRRDAVFDSPDAVLHLPVWAAAGAAQTEVRVGHVHGVVARDGDVVRAAEATSVRRAGREHRARAVLLEPIDGTVVDGAPDQAPLRVEARAARADQEHVRAAAARLRADVTHVGARVRGPFHEHGDLLVGRNLVDDVVEQA